ncbi:DUF6950 family protein [Bradyrhizobium sp. HKCCYLS2038]|uniref:DUF6950 family protein n=1 Tax=Bradyrhizobium sp. HKCCYLS2038 TaxID=3420764 RepID=UPI003EBF72A7
MTRADFEAAICAAMESATSAPMEWGADDCALWVANIEREVLGFDPAHAYRGRYRTRRGAMRTMSKLHRGGLLGQLRAVARRRGWKRVDPIAAQIGDVGLIWTEYEGKPVLATVICRKRGWFVGRNNAGVSFFPARYVSFAWSVFDDTLPLHGPVHLPQVGVRRSFVPTEIVVRDPISIALLTFAGIEATTLAVSVTTFLITTAASLAISAAVSLLTPQKGGTIDNSAGGTADYSSASAVQVTERQAVPYKRVIVGRAFVGGALFFEQVKAPYLTMGILVNYGQIDSIESVFVGSNQLAFSTFAPNTILTPIAAANQPAYYAKMRCSFRYGSATQAADPLILSRYPNVGSEFRQRGIATAVYEFAFGADTTEYTKLWGQVSRPATYLIVKGVPVYDPRDPTQTVSDPSTWKWSNNATLIQTWYLTQTFGGRIPVNRIRWDKIIDSANYDDDLIGCSDGTMIRRHTIDGVITLNQSPYQVLQDLLTSNRAQVLTSGGMVWVESSRPKSPIATIHDRILVGAISYQNDKQKSDKLNKLQVRFVSPDQEYQVVDGPVLDRTDLQATDGETLSATLALSYTQDYRRAERLQKAFLLSSRLGGTITCNVDVRLMTVAKDDLIGNVVTVASELFAKMNGTYLVTAVGFADDLTNLSLALARYDATIESAWNPETDEMPFTISTVNVS